MGVARRAGTRISHPVLELFGSGGWLFPAVTAGLAEDSKKERDGRITSGHTGLTSIFPSLLKCGYIEKWWRGVHT